MRVTVDLPDEAADWLFAAAEQRGARVDEAATAVLVDALTPAPAKEKPKRPRQEWRQPVTPLIERTHEYSRSWDPDEVAAFETELVHLHEQGATDGEISRQTEATRTRVARTRRRLGLSANQEVRQ